MKNSPATAKTRIAPWSMVTVSGGNTYGLQRGPGVVESTHEDGHRNHRYRIQPGESGDDDAREPETEVERPRKTCSLLVGTGALLKEHWLRIESTHRGRVTVTRCDVGALLEALRGEEGKLMIVVVIQHPVADYAAWKTVFDENNPGTMGALFSRVNRNVDDPDTIAVVAGFESLSAARSFVGNPDLKEAMERAGVTAPPRIEMYEEVEANQY